MGESDRVFGRVGTAILADNDQVRVWELDLAPGEESDVHHHEHDYVMVQIEGDKIAAKFEPDSGGDFAGHDYIEADVIPGIAIFASAGSMERACNVGEQRFREIIVELKSQARPGLLPVNHVALTVTDLTAALPFYAQALGLDELDRPDVGIPGAWFGAGNGVQIHLVEDSSFVPVAGPHLAFRSADLDADVVRLREMDIEVTDPADFGAGVRQVFVNDPTGNQFELNEPTS